MAGLKGLLRKREEKTAGNDVSQVCDLIGSHLKERSGTDDSGCQSGLTVTVILDEGFHEHVVCVTDLTALEPFAHPFQTNR